MACKTSHELQHNFVKLAEESGFTFRGHRPRVHLDWNKIRSIDIERVIRDRRLVTIEQHINDVLDCVLESEFDVRILDEGVVKLFRLAQLTIEYQQFCRQQLDKSVMLLREEVVSIMQEIEKNKKELRSKDEEIRKLRKKTKHGYYKPALSYGNDNIAAMILKTLSHNEDGSPGMGDKLQHYNKCKHCDKVFLNQLYLKGHVLRRHPAAEQELNNKNAENYNKNEQENPYAIENSKLRDQIDELRSKLEDMGSKFEKTETKIHQIEEKTNMSQHESRPNHKTSPNHKASPSHETSPNHEASPIHEIKQAKDKLDDQKILLEQFEEWKLVEHQKYKEEISLLKDQILENINTIKDQRLEENKHQQNIDIVQPLHNIIKEQSIEIHSLKQELIKMIKNIEEQNKKKELEVKNIVEPSPRILHDAAQQYENFENNRITPQRKMTRQKSQTAYFSEEATDSLKKNMSSKKNTTNEGTIDSNIKHKFMNERHKSLEELHRKTQELLNIDTSSETSSSDNRLQPVERERRKPLVKQKSLIEHKNLKDTKDNQIIINSKRDAVKQKPDSRLKFVKQSKKSPKHEKRENKIQEYNGDDESLSEDIQEEVAHSSPAKIVRAKITEEVHKRLVTAGVDPLQMGIKNEIFKKQRAQLRHGEEVKKKKNPLYEKTRHKILAYLDAKAAEETLERDPVFNSKIDNKSVKNSKFTSVLSNVKNKALSFIKSSEMGSRLYGKTIIEEDGKRGHLSRTPPSSVPASPLSQRRGSTDTNLSYTISPAKVRTLKKDDKQRHKKAVKVEVSKNKNKYETDSEKDSIDEIYHKKNEFRQSAKSIETLVNSPIKRPATVNEMHSPDKIYLKSNVANFTRTQSAELLESKSQIAPMPEVKRFSFKDDFIDSDAEKKTKKKFLSDDNVFLESIQPNTKGVLKNAPSNSSLSKKKVIFDLDANQTKSVSASPSQSNTDKSELYIDNVIEAINLEEEWDISSIDSHQIKASRETLTSSRTMKVAELTQRIESQLARRGEHKPGVGSVDVLRGPATGGSNTSIGSSLLDEPESPKLKPHLDKDVSDIDLSELSVDGISKDYRVK